jgi:hypothetical protein
MRWAVSVQTDCRQCAEVIRAAPDARRVEQLRAVNETLGRSRVLSPCGHFHSANRSDTCSVREIARADLVMVPSGQRAAAYRPVQAGAGQQVAVEGAGR